MTCGLLNTKLDAAYLAAREAFDEAHKTGALADNDLNLLFVYYQGIKKLKEALPVHNHSDNGITFNVDGNINLPDGTYDPDYNISLFNNDHLSGDISFVDPNAVPISNSIDDCIKFTTSTSTSTVTVPEHEDDEKIVL